MNRPTRILRLLVLLLAVYAAAGLCRTALALAREERRSASLATALAETEAGIAQLPMAPEALRRTAWQNWGLVSPEDVVFFDGG